MSKIDENRSVQADIKGGDPIGSFQDLLDSSDYLKDEVDRALEVFNSPRCSSRAVSYQQDCFLIDYKSLFRNVEVQNGRLAPVKGIDTDNMARGFHRLLQAIRSTRRIMADRVSRLSGPALDIVSNTYLSSAYDYMRLAGIHSAIYGQLSMIRQSMVLNGNKADGGDAVIPGALTDKNEIEWQIRGIILGTAVYLEKYHGIEINWWAIEPAPEVEVEVPPSPVVVEAEPPVPPKGPELLPAEPQGERPKIEIKKRAGVTVVSSPPANNPPTVSIEGPDYASVYEFIKLEAVAEDPDEDPVEYQWSQISGPEMIFYTDRPKLDLFMPSVSKPTDIVFQVRVTDKPGLRREAKSAVATHKILVVPKGELTRQMKEVAEKTGGRSRTVKERYQLVEEVISRIPIKKDSEDPKMHYQIMLLVDRSGSMIAHAGNLRESMGEIYDLARRQLAGGGEVSIAIRYYVDGVYGKDGELVPLDTGTELSDRAMARRMKEEIEARAAERRGKILTALDSIKNRFADDDEEADGKAKEIPDHPEVAAAKGAMNEIYASMDGGIEYHWEAVVNAAADDRWAVSDSVERVVFLLTDEGDDFGRNLLKETKDTAIQALQKKGIRFEHIFYDGPGGGGGCFAGESRLLKADGGTTTFSEMSDLYDKGEDPPAVAAWDLSTQTVIYQVPKAVMEREISGDFINYVFSGEDGEKSLVSTVDHLVRVERFGDMIWEQIGAVEDGDILIDPFRGRRLPNPAENIFKGMLKVYNLSFDAENTGMQPTYLISPDGVSWLIAHNKMM